MTHTLVLLRHGLSEWNLANRFTGWHDADLAEAGRGEAHEAGRLLREAGYTFDLAYTSVLKRAIRTLWITLDELDRMWIPVIRDWRLNERHYGALQGLDKAETAARYGEAQVHRWRRGFAIAPPPLAEDDDAYPGNQACYDAIPRGQLPRTESLKDTFERVAACWHERLAPAIGAGNRLLISAHGNSLRALVKLLDEVGDADIERLEIPTGVPLVYQLDGNLKPLRHQYLDGPLGIERGVAGTPVVSREPAVG